jgi:CheY-like chemotaxis protein
MKRQEHSRHDDYAIQLGTEPPLILLVDDFEDALDIYGQYLTFRGYRVVLARDGQDAVRKARTCRPDLVFLDLRMPIMTGIEALRMMRADDALATVPIVALTAHALDSERHRALEAGFDDFIAKPCLPEDLVAAVERMVPRYAAVPRVPEPECAEVRLETET